MCNHVIQLSRLPPAVGRGLNFVLRLHNSPREAVSILTKTPTYATQIQKRTQGQKKHPKKNKKFYIFLMHQ